MLSDVGLTVATSTAGVGISGSGALWVCISRSSSIAPSSSLCIARCGVTTACT